MAQQCKKRMTFDFGLLAPYQRAHSTPGGKGVKIKKAINCVDEINWCLLASIIRSEVGMPVFDEHRYEY